MEAGEGSGSGPGKDANTRHMQTEKRRRDRIASGFEVLRDLIPCKDRKLDKASFLNEIVDYVSSLQDAVQQAVLLGGIQSLPEETQWQIRLLLPRQSSEGRGGGAAPSCRAAEAVSPAAARQPSASGGMTGEPAGPSVTQQSAATSHAGAAGEASSSVSASRVQQLQAVLRQLQAQQAAGAQQYQMQQAALMHSQMFGALQHFAQQPSPLLQGSPAGTLPHAGLPHAWQPPSQAPPAQPPAMPSGQQSQADAVGRDKPQGGEEPPAATAAERSVHKPRRAPKVRRHTTAARMSNPHSHSSNSGSESGNSGRPDLSPSAPSEPPPANEPSI